jgi:hypothetical protein
VLEREVAAPQLATAPDAGGTVAFDEVVHVQRHARRLPALHECPSAGDAPTGEGSRVRPHPTIAPAETLRLDRAQRDVLQRLVVDLELGEWAAQGFELDPEDPDGQRARRERVECAFALLDDLGWETDDDRELFDVRIHAALREALLQWREWQIAAIEDVHRERQAGAPVSQTAPVLLAAAERLGVVARLLQRLQLAC